MQPSQLQTSPIEEVLPSSTSHFVPGSFLLPFQQFHGQVTGNYCSNRRPVEYPFSPFAGNHCQQRVIGLKFPNLTKVNFHISDLENDRSPSNVTPIRFPVLEDLTIEGAISCTLHPRFKVTFRLDVHSGPLPVPISSAALTSLSLVGHTRYSALATRTRQSPLSLPRNPLT